MTDVYKNIKHHYWQILSQDAAHVAQLQVGKVR